MTDEQITRIAQALYYLRDLLDQGWEYPDAEHRAATKYSVKHAHLRDAYDEFTSIRHDPEEYL